MRVVSPFTLCLFAVFILHPISYLSAQTTYTWNNTGTDWNTASHWSPSGPPTSNDIAYFGPTSSTPGDDITNPNFSVTGQALSLTTTFNPNGNGWNFSSSGVNTLTIGGTSSTGITTLGPVNTVFDGPTIAGASGTNTVALNVMGGSQLVLQGDSAISSNQGNINITGGHLALDNTAANINARVLNTGTVAINGGGTLELIGNASGTMTNFGTLSRPTGATTGLGGTNTIRVDSSAGGATVMNFANTGTPSLRAGATNVLRFEATSGALGDATNAQILFAGTPITSSTGANLLSNTAGGITVGWAVVSDSYGTNFATYHSTRGIISVANPDSGVSINTVTDTVTGLAVSVNNQLNISAGTTVTASATVNATVLRINPGAGSTLAMGTNALNSVVIMLDGSNDFAITGTGVVGTSTRYFHVNNANTTLSIQGAFTSSTNLAIFAGPGFVALTGSTLQNNGTAGNDYDITIAGGVLRGSNTQMGFDTTRGVLNLFGGVMEITGGTNPVDLSLADFRRSLGTTAGSVNWGATTSERGSGGFSAYGADASVNIGGFSTPSILQWNQANFVADGYALRFGSTQSDAKLHWLNPINLVNGTGYQLREIHVTDNTSSSADRTVMSGVISGSSTVADLLKTGNGVLELAATNTYQGNTHIMGGTLLASGTNATGTGDTLVYTSGTLQLGGANRIHTSSTLTLLGGTLKMGDSVGFDQLLDELRFASSSSITMGIGTHTLTLAAITDTSLSTDILTISGWFGDQSGGTGGTIIVTGFGTNATAANISLAGFLSKVQFTGFTSGGGAKFIASGANVQLVPVPEPATLLIAAPALALLSRQYRNRSGVTIRGKSTGPTPDLN